MEAVAELSLDTVVAYLERLGITYDLEVIGTTPIIRSGWRFDAGSAALVIAISESTHQTTRLEITCSSRQRYPDRLEEVTTLLNARNRERAFARSVDDDGFVYLEYVGFYPTGCPFPQHVFEVVFGGVLLQFEDDYTAIEAARLGEN